MSMFGEVGSFTAVRSNFNNAAGDQYNTSGPVSSVGAGDPRWQLSANPVPPRNDRFNSHPGAPSVIGNIGSIYADQATFNHTGRDQYNFRTDSARPLPTAPQRPPINYAPASAPVTVSIPAPQGISVAAAEAKMFGKITRFETEDSNFNNSQGTQVNTHYTEPYRAPSIASSVPSLEPPPRPTEKPSKTHNPFTRLRPSGSASTSTTSVTAAEPPNSTPPSDSRPTGFELGTADHAFAAADNVFSILSRAAEWSHLPGLQLASQTVIALVQAVKGAKNNQDDFTRLANHACNLVSSVVLIQEKRASEGRSLPPRLLENLVVLTEKIRPLEKILREQHMRHGFKANIKRVVLHKAEFDQIQNCRERLTQALAEFTLQSNIELQDGVAQVDHRVEQLTDAIERMIISNRSDPSPAPDDPPRPTEHPSPSFTPPEIDRNGYLNPHWQSPATSPPPSAPQSPPPNVYHSVHGLYSAAQALPNIGPGSVYNVVGGNQNTVVNHGSVSGGINYGAVPGDFNQGYR